MSVAECFTSVLQMSVHPKVLQREQKKFEVFLHRPRFSRAVDKDLETRIVMNLYLQLEARNTVL